MKSILFAILLMAPVLAHARANIVVYSEATGRVIGYFKDVADADAVPQEGVLVNPDLSGVVGLNIEYWSVSNGNVVEASAQERTRRDLDRRAKFTEISRSKSLERINANGDPEIQALLAVIVAKPATVEDALNVYKAELAK